MLTTESRCGYTESLKTCYTAFAPRQSVFFMPSWGMRAENILNISQSLIAAFSESPAFSFLRRTTKKAIKMKNAISIFKFNQNQVRTQQVDNQPYFCLSDVCAALGIKNAATSVKLSKDGVGKTYTIDNLGRHQEITIINEPNLYRLIFRSNKPQAQAFADWVYSEVLPSIRKTGGYGEPAPVDMRAIGGMVKRCVNKALTEFLQGEEKTEAWQADNHDLLLCLQNWYHTRNMKELEKTRELIRKNEELETKLRMVKQALEN